MKQEAAYKETMGPVRRRNLQSIKLATIKTITERVNQMICLSNKALCPELACTDEKEFIVKIPAADIKNKAPNNNQSMFLIKRAKDFVSYFYPSWHFFANIG